MAITRAELASWIGAELAELIEAGGLEAGDGEDWGSFANSITKALRAMGLTLASELADTDAAEVYDLAELFALERIVTALGARSDFSADGASFKLSQQHAAAVARLEAQREKCLTLWGVGGAQPTVASRSLTLGALTDEVIEYGYR